MISLLSILISFCFIILQFMLSYKLSLYNDNETFNLLLFTTFINFLWLVFLWVL